MEHYATLLGLLAVIGGSSSALVRFIGTWRSVSVSGVSIFFAWIGLSANAFWLIYGLRESVLPQTVVASLWGSVFVYIIWRLGGRRIRRDFFIGVPLVFLLGAVLTFAFPGPTAGWVGGFLTIASVTPQAFKIWTTRDLAGVVPVAWGFSLTIGILWTGYGYLAGLTPVFALNLVYVTVVLTILGGIFNARIKAVNVTD